MVIGLGIKFGLHHHLHFRIVRTNFGFQRLFRCKGFSCDFKPLCSRKFFLGLDLLCWQPSLVWCWPLCTCWTSCDFCIQEVFLVCSKVLIVAAFSWSAPEILLTNVATSMQPGIGVPVCCSYFGFNVLQALKSCPNRLVCWTFFQGTPVSKWHMSRGIWKAGWA